MRVGFLIETLNVSLTPGQKRIYKSRQICDYGFPVGVVFIFFDSEELA